MFYVHTTCVYVSSSTICLKMYLTQLHGSVTVVGAETGNRSAEFKFRLSLLCSPYANVFGKGMNLFLLTAMD